MKTQTIKLNDTFGIDLPKLIPSKLFIYANSGFGKTWLERRISEQASGKIQQIIIDPEGEFSTLREKYDFLLIGKGKDFDIQADPRTAALLAQRLLEEKVSCIIDLYELDPGDGRNKVSERDQFVANFSRALVNAPKNLWHPYLYLVDEAQDFAPENGNTLSHGPLLALAKKGRKRGCCPIFATQRVADFSKSVIAACNNKLIGQASLDIDMKRCAAELGFNTKEQMLSLRDLEPGEFYAFGPAISKTVQKIHVGQVYTSHPDSSKIGGKIGTKVVPASEKVKKALAKLADIPQAVAEEAKTVAELKSALIAAKRRVGELERAPIEVSKEVRVDVPVLNEKDIKRLEKIFEKAEPFMKTIRDILEIHRKPIIITARNVESIFKSLKPEPGQVVHIPHGKPMRVMDAKPNANIQYPQKAEFGETIISKGEREILIAIAQSEDEGATTEHIAVLTGYKQTSRRVYLNKLVAGGFARKEGETFFATEDGLNALGSDYKPLPTGRELLEHLMQTLPDGEKTLFNVIVAAHPAAVTNEFLQQETNYKATSVRVYVNKLVARKIVVKDNDGVRASDKLF